MPSKIKSFIKNYLLSRKAYRFFIRDWQPLSDLPHASEVLATMRFSQTLTPIQQSQPRAKRILVIAPHPDDEAIGPGGTLLKALKTGASVLTLYLTCGTPKTADSLRLEASQISAIHGYQTVFLNYYSKNIPADQDTVLKIHTIIQQFKPETIFIPFLLDDHDDHRRASHLLLMIQRNYPLPPNLEIWAYQVYTTLLPNVVVDITSVAKEKESFIQMWKTQNETRNWSHIALGFNAFNQRFLPTSPKPQYAECFFVLPLHEYVSYCELYFKKPSDCYYQHHYKNESSYE